MSTDRRIVLFDLFGVIARHQRPGAPEKMAARCHSSLDAFTTAYWTHRPPYDAGRHTASVYWTEVLSTLSCPADADAIEELRLTDIDSWSRVDDRMVTYVQSLRDRAEVALLSNIPADHADVFLAAHPWLHSLDHVAFSGKIKAAKPDPAAFQHCVIALQAAPADFLFVDDREENVRAAQTAGMNGHIFTGQNELSAVIDGWLPTRGSPSSASELLDGRRRDGGEEVDEVAVGVTEQE
ncbi:HAD-IA family hydrolase [Streptomyces lasiicapitis]|uniref:HAD-IA family hydrolase n=1 Tax=Streptomyces lasiicapitis TaxID=1923961 RepID=UPI003330D51D